MELESNYENERVLNSFRHYCFESFTNCSVNFLEMTRKIFKNSSTSHFSNFIKNTSIKSTRNFNWSIKVYGSFRNHAKNILLSSFRYFCNSIYGHLQVCLADLNKLFQKSVLELRRKLTICSRISSKNFQGILHELCSSWYWAKYHKQFQTVNLWKCLNIILF